MGRPRLPHVRYARCHPGRWAVDGDRCRDCALPDPQPVELIIPASGDVPRVCPHCGSESGWRGDTHYRHCFYCGEDWEHRVMLVFA